MPEITGEGFISNTVNKAGSYYMFLTIDGQKQRRPTGTKDAFEANEKLEQWKTEVKAGFKEDARMRYEKLRDDYLESGKHVQQSILDDLNAYFKNMRISSITTSKLKDFRKWREGDKAVLAYKEKSFQNEVAVRTLKLRKLTPGQLETIQEESREWVENAVKATTNRRLTALRAMFNYAVKQELISKNDVPYFPMAAGVDNVRTGTVSDEMFENILKELPGTLHPYLVLLNATGMRSGQAEQLTWDMVNEDRTVLNIPGTITKSRKPQTLALVNKEGKPFTWSMWIKKAVRVEGQPIFDTTDFRSQWRQACHKLKFGVYDPEKQTYRGLKPHDFRRTAISRMTENGVDRAVVKSISGHKTDSVFNRYDIKDLRQQQRAFEIMSGK
jgi:integrase